MGGIECFVETGDRASETDRRV